MIRRPMFFAFSILVPLVVRGETLLYKVGPNARIRLRDPFYSHSGGA